MSGREGKLNGGASEAECLASIADWYLVYELDISGASGDIDLTEEGGDYEGLVLKQVGNLSTTANATVKFKQANDTSTTITLPIGIMGNTGKLPAIHTIVQTGTSDNLLLYFQKR